MDERMIEGMERTNVLRDLLFSDIFGFCSSFALGECVSV